MECGGGGGAFASLDVKGNLAHNLMYVIFLCLSFHLDISNRLKD